MRTPRVFSRRVLSTMAAASVAMGSMVASAIPANALVFGKFAGDTPEAAAVVRLVIPKNGLAETVCTGTAISPQWVLTAGHCIDGGERGTVTVGQSFNTHQFQVDRTVGSPHGDLALVKVGGDLGLGFYPPVRFTTPTPGTQATVYGWSSWGMGISGHLPMAGVTTQECPGNVEQCASGQYILSQSKLPTLLQSGDSGGPMFVDGGVVGVMSALVSLDPRPVEITGQYLHTRVQMHEHWVRTTAGV